MSEWFTAGERVRNVSIDDRSVQYGDGLFETIAVRDAEPRFLEAHLERLEIGCTRLGIEAPDRQKLPDDLRKAIERSKVDKTHAVAKILVSAGSGTRGYRRRVDAEPAIFIGIFDSAPVTDEHYRHGVTVRVCTTRLARQVQLAGIKSLNRLEQVLARAEWNDDSVFEGLMSDTERQLICGTMSNVFLVTHDTIITPAITHCGVAGIMRAHIIAQMKSAQLEFEIRDVRADELADAEEVFLTNSQIGILPVRRCGARQWPVGPITRQLMQIAADSGVSECAR